MYLVFDVGGTFVKYGLLDNEGVVLEKGKFHTHTLEKELFLQDIKQIYDIYKDRGLKGIALSIPGLVDAKAGILLKGGSLKCMYETCITEEVSRICGGLKVSAENDGKCAGLAEAWIGAAKDVPNCCVLAFGTAVAGAVIVDKKVLHGNHLIAGEMSYLCTSPESSPLDIHRLGTEYSAIGIVKKAGIAIKDPHMTGEKLFALYNKKQSQVVEIMEDFFFHVACQCYNLQYIVDPDVICIGGGISERTEVVEGIRKYCRIIFEQTKQFRMPKVVACQFRNDSNLIGALYHYKQLYEQNI